MSDYNGSFRTPQNTPAQNAPISSRAQAPGLGSLKEGMLETQLPLMVAEQRTDDNLPAEDVERATAANLLARNNPALVSMIQNKLSGLVGQSSGYIESLPAPVRRRITGLKGVQKEHSKLEAQFQEEVLELEKKFFAKFSPLYKKRADIVNGKSEPSQEEITAGEEDEDEDDDEEGAPASKNESTDEGDSSIKGIPEFWLTAMKNNPSLADLITERDEAALKHLTDIRMEYLDQPGFKLIFEFSSANDFFSNKTISKTYFYQEESGYGGDFIYDHADGDKIEWKSGKDLTMKTESKKQRNKSMLLGQPFSRSYTNRCDRHQANSRGEENCSYRLFLQLLLTSQASG